MEQLLRAETPQRKESLPSFRRPESVLIVIYTAAGEFLLLERVRPAGFWQSVTGSLEWGESAGDAARREIIEETGISQGLLRNMQWTQVYEILPSFGKKYAPGITRNLEHAFALKLQHRVPVTLSATEHVQYRWMPAALAIDTVSSSTNRTIIEQLRFDKRFAVDLRRRNDAVRVATDIRRPLTPGK